MEIIDIDELVPDDISFKYRGESYTIPGDLKTGLTLELYALLTRLARTEAKGNAGELKRVIGQAEAALLPIFQVHHPDMTELPFGAAGLGVVLRKVLQLIGLLEVGAAPDVPDPPLPVPKPPPRRATSIRTRTKPGSRSLKSKPAKKTVPGSPRSKS